MLVSGVACAVACGGRGGRPGPHTRHTPRTMSTGPTAHHHGGPLRAGCCGNVRAAFVCAFWLLVLRSTEYCNHARAPRRSAADRRTTKAQPDIVRRLSLSECHLCRSFSLSSAARSPQSSCSSGFVRFTPRASAAQCAIWRHLHPTAPALSSHNGQAMLHTHMRLHGERRAERRRPWETGANRMGLACNAARWGGALGACIEHTVYCGALGVREFVWGQPHQHGGLRFSSSPG